MPSNLTLEVCGGVVGFSEAHAVFVLTSGYNRYKRAVPGGFLGVRKVAVDEVTDCFHGYSKSGAG